MKIVPRAEWKAAPPKRELVEAPISELEGIAVHWFGSPNAAKTHDRCAALIKSVQTTHMKEPRNYSDIAYNHLVCHHGFVFEGRGFGFVPGANGTRESNRSHAAIAYMVGWDDGPDIYSTKGLGNLATIIQQWIKRGAGTDVRPHGTS